MFQPDTASNLISWFSVFSFTKTIKQAGDGIFSCASLYQNLSEYNNLQSCCTNKNVYFYAPQCSNGSIQPLEQVIGLVYTSYCFMSLDSLMCLDYVCTIDLCAYVCIFLFYAVNVQHSAIVPSRRRLSGTLGHRRLEQSLHCSRFAGKLRQLCLRLTLDTDSLL